MRLLLSSPRAVNALLRECTHIVAAGEALFPSAAAHGLCEPDRDDAAVRRVGRALGSGLSEYRNEDVCGEVVRVELLACVHFAGQNLLWIGAAARELIRERTVEVVDESWERLCGFEGHMVQSEVLGST